MPPKPITPLGSNDAVIKHATLIRIPQIKNGAAMGFALSETHKYFTNPEAIALGWTPPPIPADVLGFIPCALLITDGHNIVTGENTGRIRFLRDVQGSDEMATHSDQTWVLSAADN